MNWGKLGCWLRFNPFLGGPTHDWLVLRQIDNIYIFYGSLVCVCQRCGTVEPYMNVFGR